MSTRLQLHVCDRRLPLRNLHFRPSVHLVIEPSQPAVGESRRSHVGSLRDPQLGVQFLPSRCFSRQSLGELHEQRSHFTDKIILVLLLLVVEMLLLLLVVVQQQALFFLVHVLVLMLVLVLVVTGW